MLKVGLGCFYFLSKFLKETEALLTRSVNTSYRKQTKAPSIIFVLIGSVVAAIEEIGTLQLLAVYPIPRIHIVGMHQFSEQFFNEQIGHTRDQCHQ